MSKEYKQGVVRLWIGPKLTVFLFDPRDIELILSSQIYIDKSTEYRFFAPWLGEGLLISTGIYTAFFKQLFQGHKFGYYIKLITCSRAQMEVPPQNYRPYIPSERAEEFRGPVQRELEACGEEAFEGGRKVL